MQRRAVPRAFSEFIYNSTTSYYYLGLEDLEKKETVRYLEDAFGEGRLLRELLEVLGIRIVIGSEIGFEHAQLVVLERRTQTFCLL